MNAPTQNPDGLERWRIRAENVASELSEIVEHFQNLGASHPQIIHALFAELYLQTTRRWLEGLEHRADSEFAYRVMCHFMALYRQHVIARLDDPLDQVAAHWRSYHYLARRQNIRSAISLHLLLISMAVRAHVRWDLGVAMSLAEQDIGHARKGKEIFGRLSETAFFLAASDYIALHRARQRGWRRFVLGLYRIGLFALRPIWLTVIQRWRRNGYGEAVSSRSSNAPSAGRRVNHFVP